MKQTRRRFLASSGCGLAVASSSVGFAGEQQPGAQPQAAAELKREVGITTGSFSRQLRADPKRFALPGLLDVVRHELDMRVVDVYTPSLVSFEPAYLDRVRRAAERTGCILTNLKMNQPRLDLGSPDDERRGQALAEYKHSIDAAARLGMRWARPLPTKQRPGGRRLIDGLRELADYAADRHVQLLVENFGWMQSDASSVVRLIKAIDRPVAASPDTGNWSDNEVRYRGLAVTFPVAVTCDFKARSLTADGEHAAYDLKRCFTIGWDAGFRGPWCLEHGHPDTETLFSHLVMPRDFLRKSIAKRV